MTKLVKCERYLGNLVSEDGRWAIMRSSKGRTWDVVDSNAPMITEDNCDPKAWAAKNPFRGTKVECRKYVEKMK